MAFGEEVELLGLGVLLFCCSSGCLFPFDFVGFGLFEVGFFCYGDRRFGTRKPE